MSSPVRVRSAGAALPSLRLPAAEVGAAWGSKAGRGQVAACAADEDVLTLAWAAAADAIEAAGLDPLTIDALFWGTTRPPFAEGPSHVMLAAAVGLPATAGGALLAGSPHAGMEALFAAWDAVAAGAARQAVVVVADALRPGLGTAAEARTGAGAAALVLSAGSEGPATLTGRATRSQPVLDRYRGDGEATTRDLYDPRLFREEVFLPLVTGVGAALGDDVTAWSLPDPDGRLGAAAGRKLGAAPDTLASAAVFAATGDTGAAAALLGVLPALAAGSGTVAVVGYGGGRASGTTIAVDTPVPGADRLATLLPQGRPAAYAEVLRARGELVASGDPVPMGVPPGSAAFVRGNHEILALTGARCVECGTVNTPPSIHPSCIACGGDKFDEVALGRGGRVHTFVVNQTMPAPFVAPLPLAVIDLDDGARVMLQVTGDAEGLAIDDRVELVLRRYALERGAPVYGYKALRTEGAA